MTKAATRSSNASSGAARRSFSSNRSCRTRPVIHRNLSDMDKVLNQFVYQKGGWTLHMLRYLIGDSRVLVGIRDYYTRYRNQNASTDDLRA